MINVVNYWIKMGERGCVIHGNGQENNLEEDSVRRNNVLCMCCRL